MIQFLVYDEEIQSFSLIQMLGNIHQVLKWIFYFLEFYLRFNNQDVNSLFFLISNPYLRRFCSDMFNDVKHIIFLIRGVT